MQRGPAARPRLRDRVGAALFDAAFAALLGAGAGELAELALGAAGAGQGAVEALRRLFLIAAHGGYSVALMAGPRQSTFGQRWFKLKLVGATGGRPSPGEAFGRWLAFVAAVLPLGAGLLLSLGPERRPLQDRLCQAQIVGRLAPMAERKAA
jgi:uncharacterized RDD family membrane protein YckC